MKILLVNNGDAVPEQLLKMLGERNTLQIIDWKNDEVGDDSAYDLIVISGTQSMPTVGNEKLLRSELDLIAKTKKPILGICYGCELIAFVFGAHLERMEGEQSGIAQIEVKESDPLFGDCKNFQVKENHRWLITDVPQDLKALAYSAHGIEAVKHATRPIYGLQFYPERCKENVCGEKIFSNYFSLLEKTLG